VCECNQNSKQYSKKKTDFSIFLEFFFIYHMNHFILI